MNIIKKLVNLRDEIQKELANVVGVQKIFIYRDIIVCVSFIYKDINITLDIDENENIVLSIKNDKTLHFLNEFYGVIFNKRHNLVKGRFFDSRFISSANKDLSLIIKEILESFTNCLKAEGNNLYLISEFSQNILEEVRKYREDVVFKDMGTTFLAKQKNIIDTLLAVKERELSVARFGDGEIKCMVTQTGCSFQNHNWILMRELIEITKQPIPNLLVCYPGFLVHNDFWRDFWRNYWFKVKPYLKLSEYGNAMISRPEAFNFYGDDVSKIWMDIYSKKNVCFVTGHSSRLDIDHYLFSTIKSKKTITTKNNNSYSEIDKVLELCLSLDDIDMFLIALGPTGTVLASRLALVGRRAIDIGHMPNSYDTVFKGGRIPERIRYSRD